MAGLTLTGFDTKPLSQIQDEIETALKAVLGPSLDLSADSVLGQVVGVFSSQLAEVWEVAQAVYAAAVPDTASGAALDALCLLTGCRRLEASPSRLLAVTLTGTPATSIAAGSVIRTAAGDRFKLDATTVLGGGGTAVASFTAEETGPRPYASPGPLTIATPVAGWASATSATDAVLGRDIETDAALRARRELLLAQPGSATVNAIRAAVLSMANVNECFVFENPTDFVDGAGVPPHAFEVVLDDDGLADNDDVAQTILGVKPAGIEAHGTDSGTGTDSQGFDHVIKFTRADPVDVQLQVFVSVIADEYPADGDAQIKAALAAHIDALLLGRDIVFRKLFEPIFNVSGVHDVPTLLIGLVGGGLASNNIVVLPRKKASVDVADIFVLATPVSVT